MKSRNYCVWTTLLSRCLCFQLSPLLFLCCCIGRIDPIVGIDRCYCCCCCCCFCLYYRNVGGGIGIDRGSCFYLYYSNVGGGIGIDRGGGGIGRLVGAPASALVVSIVLLVSVEDAAAAACTTVSVVSSSVLILRSVLYSLST